ncbi:unnamed protein product [Cuscuta campestris]|uniref:Uncharacterized protein n=1 Tax=Cuscuta campestris TaxID=132261 RepID=A0A484N0U0_9ASTE|nr:unnamed protein product [Cuscuta campestris]
MQVFYVDRVAVDTRSVPRMFPAVVGWTTKTLRERENTEVKDGGFGIGHDDGRLGVEQLIVMVNTMDDDAQEHESSANESDAPVDLVVEDSEEDAPKTVTRSANFVKMQNVWGKLIGIHVEKDGADKTCSVEPQSVLLDDNPIWSSPEVIVVVDLAEKAAQKTSRKNSHSSICMVRGDPSSLDPSPSKVVEEFPFPDLSYLMVEKPTHCMDIIPFVSQLDSPLDNKKPFQRTPGSKDDYWTLTNLDCNWENTEQEDQEVENIPILCHCEEEAMPFIIGKLVPLEVDLKNCSQVSFPIPKPTKAKEQIPRVVGLQEILSAATLHPIAIFTGSKINRHLHIALTIAISKTGRYASLLLFRFVCLFVWDLLKFLFYKAA